VAAHTQTRVEKKERRRNEGAGAGNAGSGGSLRVLTSGLIELRKQRKREEDCVSCELAASGLLKATSRTRKAASITRKAASRTRRAASRTRRAASRFEKAAHSDLRKLQETARYVNVWKSAMRNGKNTTMLATTTTATASLRSGVDSPLPLLVQKVMS